MLLAAMVLSQSHAQNCLKMSVGSGGSGVGIPYNSTFRYYGPWHARIAITFSLVNIFTCGFLQRVKDRLDIILKC